jgi:hypothetical protein
MADKGLARFSESTCQRGNDMEEEDKMTFEQALSVLRAKKTGWKAAQRNEGLTDDELEALNLLSDLDRRDWERAPRVACPEGVVIIGKSAGHCVAPWMEEGWEFWGLNEQGWRERGTPIVDNYDRWFQLHPPSYLEKHYPVGMDDLRDWWGIESGRGLPLYMDKHYPEYPDSVPFPKEEVEALTSMGWYHASSMDWMLALAILEGFKRIIIAGVTFDTFPFTNGEPISARACMEHWTGVAMGRGIEVEYAGPMGDMFQIIHLVAMRSRHQYGFDAEPGRDLAEVTNWEEYR